MKFIFADALDMVDPAYDFQADRASPDRERYWGDKYPHEFFPTPPYDGVLVSKGVVGGQKISGKYSESQAMRFRRVGAREFLRLNGPAYKNFALFGDCGAFSYVDADKPPYTTDEILDFYSDAGFTHACSVDHVIFDFEPTHTRGLQGGTKEARARYDITQENAKAFFRASRSLGKSFTPLGVVQGWSPGSMAEAARNLERMGYRYIAIGGMVPLASPSIHLCLQAIRERIKRTTKIHLLGFAKAEQIGEFTKYGIASFDSTSPLIRAFKDARANYYARAANGSLEYYTAIRIPRATENARLLRKAKEGKARQEDLVEKEQRALTAVRAFDRGRVSVQRALDAVLDYNRDFLMDDKRTGEEYERKLAKHAMDLRRTLEKRPWTTCKCAVCKQAGVEVIIFRSSNRNKRRGFHNLSIYYDHFRRSVQ
jgi:hypothetical protein